MNSPFASLFSALTWLTMAGQPLAAQAVQTRVIDASSQEPLPRVIFVVSDGEDQLWSALTDTAGQLAVPWNQWIGRQLTLRLRRIGYRPLSRVIRVDSVLLYSPLSIPLDRAPVSLEDITITGARVARRLRNAGFYERQRAGLGHFITEEDIVRRQPRWPTDLFRAIPGITVSVLSGKARGGTISVTRAQQGSFRGPCPARILIDGVVVAGPSAGRFYLDEYLTADEIAAIEVYRGPAETPAAFGGADAACGVILIWTK